MTLKDNLRGNYRFLPGVAPYSSGVVAMPGYEIAHAVLHRPLPYRDGFASIERHLAAAGRPRLALCGVELRSTRPLSLEGFGAFNEGYRQVLVEWDALVDGVNPVARTNVAPEVYPPAQPSLYAFSYTVPAVTGDAPPTFVVAGAGETRQGSLRVETVVRAGETSADALREKAACVMETMQARLVGLGVTPAQVTTANVYTVSELQPYLAETILAALGPAAVHGVHWYYTRPPIVGIEFEMDLRGVRREMRVG
jgi:hypothetical protein